MTACPRVLAVPPDAGTCAAAIRPTGPRVDDSRHIFMTRSGLVLAPASDAEFPGRELGSGDPGADLCESGLAGGGGVVAERRKPAVVAGP